MLSGGESVTEVVIVGVAGRATFAASAASLASASLLARNSEISCNFFISNFNSCIFWSMRFVSFSCGEILARTSKIKVNLSARKENG